VQPDGTTFASPQVTLTPGAGGTTVSVDLRGVTAGTPASLFCDRGGRIWAGTSMGLSRLDPAPDSSSAAPRVFITALTTNGTPRAVSEPGARQISGIRLPWDQRQLSVSYAGVGAAPGEAVEYQYRLEGWDTRWSSPTTERSVSYAGLGAGRFRFLVRAVTAEGLASGDPAAVSFEILAPVWQRWWFLALVCAAISAAALFAHRYDVGRRLEIERIRMRIARDLHDDIGASLSRVAILTELARREEQTETPRDAHLNEIGEIARGMVDGLGDLVWAIDPRSDDVGGVARRVRRCASDILTAQGIGWELEMPEESAALPLGPDQRRHLLFIFQEAIRNAARHSGASFVAMSLARVDAECIARIADDGRGLADPASEDGNGLQNLRARAAALGGMCSIVSRPASGVEVMVRFPISDAHVLPGRIRMLFRGAARISPNRS